MKQCPSFISAVLLAASVAPAFGQGTIVFNNGTGLVWQPDFSQPLPGERLVPIGGGQVQLFWAPSGTAYTPWTPSLSGAAWFAANPGWKLEAPVGFNAPLPGRFNGGALTLSPLAPGGMIDYAVIGWTGSASSMDAALAGAAFVDVSAKFTSATGNPTTIPPGTPVPLSISFGGLHIGYIPEPSGFALAGVAVATLLAFRRRNQSHTRQS